MRGWQLPECLVTGVTCHKGKQRGIQRDPYFAQNWKRNRDTFSLCLFAFTYYSKGQVFVKAGF